MIRKPASILKRIAQLCRLTEEWSFELICNHPNTAAAVYKVTNTATGQVLALKIEQGRHPKLIAEVKYLVSNGRRFPFLPEIFAQGKAGSYHFYLMEYMGGYISFSELYARNRLRKYHIELILNTLQQVELSLGTSVSIEGVYRRHYLNRLEKRLKPLKRSYLNELLDYEYVYINGQRLENIPSFWRKALPRLATPFFTKAAPFPGDVHFEHVLINKSRRLKVIDPNGASRLPLAYDIGKLLHSLHGGYDTFKSLDFELQLFGGNKFDLSYHFPVKRGSLLRYFNEGVLRRWGADAVRAGYLSELFHFTCLIPHHLKVRKEALGFYCRTVELIDSYKKHFGYAE